MIKKKKKEKHYNHYNFPFPTEVPNKKDGFIIILFCMFSYIYNQQFQTCISQTKIIVDAGECKHIETSLNSLKLFNLSEQTY